MINKKGYNGLYTFIAFAIGIVIGIGILWYVLGQGWLSGFIPTPATPPA